MDGERSGFEIAIVGMSGRFPGAADLQEFWVNLAAEVESIRFFSVSELEGLGRNRKITGSAQFVPAHGVMDGFDLFDADYFGFSPWEADVLDPQHRVFLQCAAAALEDAGYDPFRYPGLIGVYAGASVDNYLYQNVLTSDRLIDSVQHYQANYLNQADFLTTRVSYKLGLRGPSFSIQSACSTSLIAVHQACQQLLSGACDMALAGGVSLTLPQNWGYLYEEGMILSPDGHCRAFDERAQGVLKGDGVGVVVLKRLADAEADGDAIDAIILGSACNNDGNDKVGYSAPGINGQIDVIHAALEMAEVNPETIDYVECHGTGTPMGDPIEVSALTQVYRKATSRRNFCGIGSVKSNIGHLDAAAGVAGLIKTVLALKHQVLPATVNFARENARIDFANSPFYVNHKTSNWITNNKRRRAGVSSFGIGGSNAHVILEEAPREPVRETIGPEYSLFPVSARSLAALDEVTSNLADHLRKHPELALVDVARTLQEGRVQHEFRKVIVSNSQAALIAALDSGGDLVVSGTPLDSQGSVVFLFTGQGSQYVNMGRDLYESDESFRADIDHCAEILQNFLAMDIRETLYPEAGESTDALRNTLTQTVYAQPALFVVEYAVARRWIRQGIKPTAVVGHSLGELCAACIAGIFSLEDALELVAARGQSMQAMPPGVMSAIALPEEVIVGLLDEQVALAAVNAPSLCVISGPEQAVMRVEAALREIHGVEGQRLHTSHAFHSPMMAAAEEPFFRVLARCRKNSPTITVFSSVTGQLLTAEQAIDTRYWLRNFRDTVRFSDAVRNLPDDALLLEVGPGNTLATLARKQRDEGKHGRFLSSLHRPDKTLDDRAHWLLAQGQIWIAGHALDWASLPGQDSARRVHLPHYPFARTRHWIEPERRAPGTAELSFGDGPVGLDDWFYIPTWKRTANTIPGRSQGPQSWLVFKSSNQVSDSIIANLGKSGSSVIEVSWAENYSHQGNSFTVNPHVPDHMTRLIGELLVSGHIPPNLLHCCLIDDANEQEQGFWSLFTLIQAMHYHGLNEPLTLTVIASRSQIVLGNETIVPGKSTALGLIQVLPAEMPNVTTRFIDVQESGSEGSFDARDICCVVNEITTKNPDFLVAFRNGLRWRYDVEKASFPAGKGTPEILRQSGTYLITGGTSGIGLLVAGWLVDTLKANLVLVSRKAGSQTPAEDTELHRIVSAGGGVELLSADVADSKAMAEVFAGAVEKYGRVDGVFHAAGIAGGGLVATQERQRIEASWEPKLKGTDVIYELASKHGTDFIVLFSSLTSQVGFPGRADYTAANLYLDATAQKAFLNTPFPVYSVNWDTWSGVGMAMTTAGERDAGAGRIDQKSGLEALRRLLGSREPQVIVSTRPLKFAAIWSPDRATGAGSVTQVQDESPVSQEGTPLASGNDVEDTLCRLWQELLGVERVKPGDNFFELGGDSIVSIQLVSRARQQGINVTTRQIFEHQTVSELAQVVKPVVDQQRNVDTALTGSFPLSPVQAWFFEQDFAHSNQWNLSKWITLPDEMDPGLLSEAIRCVVAEHAILHTRFRVESGQWRQEVVDAANLQCFTREELPGGSHAERQEYLDARALHFQESLDLDSGLLLKIVLFQAADCCRLLIVAHHLVMDLISLDFLVEALKDTYERLRSGTARQMPAQDTAFRAWVETLVRYVRSESAKPVADYWLGHSKQQVAPIPRDIAEGANTVSCGASCRITLDAGLASRLVRYANQSKQAQMQDLLLAALAASLLEWSGNEAVCIDIEGHGRESLDEGVEVARAMGWFTSIYPLVVVQPERPAIENSVELVREARTSLPLAGLGYGMMRYLHPDQEVRAAMSRGPLAETVFLYRGQVGQLTTTPELAWQSSAELAAGSRHPNQQRTHLLEVNMAVADGLEIEIGYSREIHQGPTIQRLLSLIEEKLQETAALSDNETGAGPKKALNLSLLQLSDSDRSELAKILSGDQAD